VYFRADAAELTPQAQVIVVQAVQRARQLEEAHRFDHIKVIGYSDAVSAPDAAQKLSAQRAQMIKEALASQGVAADRIQVEGRGRKRPVLKPGVDVRELGNRRGRIVIYLQQ